MFLLVGLGNPGDKYQNNRHNVGFMAIDKIADDYSFSIFKKKFQGLISEGRIDGQKILLLKPQTFMNKSGNSVALAAKFFKISPQNIIIFYDELDLVPGKVRVKINGGNGGHNGLRSIDKAIGKEYKRVRIGIGRPGDKNKVTKYVLGDFTKKDKEWLEPLLEKIAQNVVLLLNEKDSQFMNKMALAPAAAPENKNIKNKSDNIKNNEQNSKAEPTNPMSDILKKIFGQ